MDRLGFESFVLLWPLTYLGAVVMWFYVYGKARAWWYCYHALLLAVCGAHLAIVLTSARELWPLLVVQSWQLGGFAIYALGILPFTVLIVAAPLLRDRVQQKRSAVESILPGDVRVAGVSIAITQISATAAGQRPIRVRVCFSSC